MTFSIPADLAATFVRRVPARERSRYLAEALAARLEERDRKLIAACEIANLDSEVASIEREFDLLNDPIVEPWTVPAKRHRESRNRDAKNRDAPKPGCPKEVKSGGSGSIPLWARRSIRPGMRDRDHERAE
jgi:hypothetical protein